ncbi:MAG: 4-(cytidine 5'-diphospho)-2-C-methyl-D-erythritol kinase [Ruminococcaceae bacterium]|nr:4-(cytidine 5'-diphospho)-2-C-methyl-D-erythritol kinase [Oscillospiraceae bacterium]
MSNVYTGLAYSKINLHLDVLNRMENGYHNVESIMQSVSLCDKLSLTVDELPNDSECVIEIVANNSKIPNDKTNLVYKCAKKLLDYTEIRAKKCIFTIEKNIPIAAGMAGGSSDGACAMKLLNSALGNLLSYDELCKIGAQVGADIPFCLTGGTCICKGIGEKITPINSFKDIYLVSAIDYSSVSTPVAFSMLDEKFGTDCTSSKNIENMVNAIENNDISAVASLLYNKFEEVIIPTNENVQKIKDIMIDSGALGALMSGSGPSVFGIFMDENSQKNAYEALKNCSINAFLCKTI